MTTLWDITAAAGWGNEPFNLLTLVDWRSVMTYESDFDAFASDLVEAATRCQAYRLLLTISDPVLGEQIAERLREHPIIAGWMEIRFQTLPRTVRRELTALVVMDGYARPNGAYALPHEVRVAFNIGRYAVLATATGMRDLAVDSDASQRLFFQMNRAIGLQAFNDEPGLASNSRIADMIILLADEKDERTLRRAVWLTRQMVEGIPIHFATISRTENGGYRLKRQY